MLTLTPLVKETHSVQKIHAVPQSHSHSSKRVPGKAGWGPGRSVQGRQRNNDQPENRKHKEEYNRELGYTN